MTFLDPAILTPAVLLGIGVLMILTGRLVPRSYVDDVRTDRDVRVAEAREETAEWRKTAMIKDEQLKVLMSQGETTIALLHSIQQHAEERSP